MKLSISVPKPCHENWEAMTPATKGRHCEQCDHTVADLTRATDAELVALFSSDARPKCARFDPRQLDRIMSNEPPQRASAIPVAAFTSLLAVAAGSEALAQDRPGRLVGEVAISKQIPPPPAVKGNAMPIPHSIPAPPEPIRFEVEGVVEPLDPLPPVVGDSVLTPVETPEPTFDIENANFLNYDVQEDEIIQRIETGNVQIQIVKETPEAGAMENGMPSVVWWEEAKARDEAMRLEQLHKDSAAAALAQEGAYLVMGHPRALPKEVVTPDTIPSEGTDITRKVNIGDDPIGDVVLGLDPQKEGALPDNGTTITIRGGRTYCYIDGVQVPASGVPASTFEEVQVITGGIPEPAVIPDTIEICGRLQDANTNEPLIFAGIRVWQHDVSGMTDENGDFKLRVPVREADDLLVLELMYMGYEGRTAEVFLKTPDGAPPIAVIDAPLTPPIDPRDPQGLSGFVRDAATNEPLPQAVVRVKGSTNAVRCDAEGRFFLKVDDATNAEDFELEIVDATRGAQMIPLHAGAVPCCVPVQFTPVPAPPIPDRDPKACIDVGALNMRSNRIEMLHTVGFIAVRMEPEHSGWRRMTAPLRRTWQKLLH